ncbi:uncharacterized protein LOC109720372 [Ananas comosus]|uniref:Uncharacterized protein LOC109720372 n=1 Tax=Ananas comosus TaxID=4615 RepID=A0A6P5GAY3_ANACO|nr:uncharacterized protein LOC109720372 [Ananas comosus]
MAITHDDLSLRRARAGFSDVSGRLAVFLVALSIVCGLVSFILCLAAEASRSEATWYLLSMRGDGTKISECFYNSSGRTVLACAVCAFLLLAVAMFAEHAYMLVAVASPAQHGFSSWTAADDPRIPASMRALTWQACFLFLITWLCFAIAEILLMIGISVESGHLSDWKKPRSTCHTIRPGVFAAAGILGLITVFLGFILYLTALRAQRLQREAEGPHHQAPPFPPSAPPEGEAAPRQDPSPSKTSTSA